MKTTQYVCNYALLRFLPDPETEEFVNVGVVANCLQPCFLHFLMEPEMPARVKAFFPMQSEAKFESARAAMQEEFKRLEAMINQARDPKSCQIAFNEAVRPRESVFRFGDTRTIFTANPKDLAEELFNRYVRMQPNPKGTPQMMAAGD